MAVGTRPPSASDCLKTSVGGSPKRVSDLLVCNMRKIFVHVLSIVLLAFVVGCTGGGSQAPQKIMKGDYDRVPGAAEKAAGDETGN